MMRRAASVLVLVSLVTGGTAFAAERNPAAALVDTLQRELGITRSAAEIQRGLTALDREQASLQYTAELLDHAGSESMRRLSAYAESQGAREAGVRARGRTLYKLARGGAARLAFGEALGEDARGDTAARLARAHALRELVRHDLHELASHRRAGARARAELLSATREQQALATATEVLAIETAVLEHAESALAPDVAAAAKARKLALQRAGHRARVAERELIGLVRTNADELDALRGLAGGRLQRPVRGKTVGSFGRYLDRVLAVPMLRQGLEIAAGQGEKVVAIAAGRVALVTELPEYGGAVIVEHEGGQLSLTARLWKITVAVGDRVEPGQAIGSAAPKDLDDGLGRTIYLELRHGERPVDPEPLLERPRTATRATRVDDDAADAPTAELDTPLDPAPLEPLGVE